jgi:hypothetical protein
MVSFQAKLRKILEGLAIEDVGIFYVHLVDFPDIWNILLPFGIFSPVLVHFYPLLVCCAKTNLATLRSSGESSSL